MEPSLKNHPQKYYVKLICNVIYYCGMGDIWYEKRKTSEFNQIVYKSWCVVTNIFGLVVILSELLAMSRDDLTVKERNDLMQFTFGHPTISAKIIILYIKRGDIKAFFKRFLENNTDSSIPELNNQAVKRALMYCSALVGILMMAILVTLIDAVKAYLMQGIPIRTEVAYYPRATDTGTIVNILRAFIELHFLFIILVMLSIDCLSLCSLVFLGFKFRRVRIYFEKLGEKFDKRIATSDEFERDFINGIQLHEDALWCARNVQKSMGYIYSVQIIESITLLVVSLVRLVGAGHSHNMTLFASGLAATFCMVIVTGSYMMDSADVTYEALQIPTAIFHCGWENVPIRPGLRSIIIITLQRSQHPVYLTAFGFIKLSYTSFISILRSSYSFFAVMY